jgi:hypothetical protein
MPDQNPSSFCHYRSFASIIKFSYYTKKSVVKSDIAKKDESGKGCLVTNRRRIGTISRKFRKKH